MIHNQMTIQYSYMRSLKLKFTYLQHQIVMVIPTIAMSASNGIVTPAAMLTALFPLFSTAASVDSTLRYLSSTNSGPGFCGSSVIVSLITNLW